MSPIRQTFPVVGPNPPSISNLYLFMAYTVTAFQSTPSGTLIVVTVGVLAPGAAMKHSSPISFRPKINKAVM